MIEKCVSILALYAKMPYSIKKRFVRIRESGSHTNACADSFPTSESGGVGAENTLHHSNREVVGKTSILHSARRQAERTGNMPTRGPTNEANALLDDLFLRKIAYMYYEDNLSQEDIAEKISFSRQFVSKALQRAKERG